MRGSEWTESRRASPGSASGRRTVLRSGRSHWAVLAFFVGFFALVVLVSNYYLFPALMAAHGATPEEKRRLAAYSTLLLAVVLFCLASMLMLTFRIGRFFFPRLRGPRVQTKYVDAWAEAGKRFEEKKE